MTQVKYTPEQIIQQLRSAEVELSKGTTIPVTCKKIGVSENTYYRWRSEYGGLRLDQAKKLKALAMENSRLKKMVADQALEISIRREAASGNF